MIDVSLAYPFSLGLVAAFNPCGFAMLPTYLAYFVGVEDSDRGPFGNMVRGLIVGATVTAGFVAVFGIIGIITRNLFTNGAIEDRLPWVTLVIGALLIPLGIAMVAGVEPKLSLPRFQKGGDSRELASMFLFGVSYAVVSFGCTAPLFISQVATSFTSDGTTEGVASFLAYSAGMGLIVIFLTMAVALARASVARNLRRVLPYVNRVSGILLILGGIYVVSYGWWEIQVLDDPTGAFDNPAQTRLEEFRTTVSEWVRDVGPERLGLILALGIAALLVWAAQLQLRSRARLQLVGAATAVWLLAEALNEADLYLRPTARLVGGLPARIGHWFTDPLRWGVPLEDAHHRGDRLVGGPEASSPPAATHHGPRDDLTGHIPDTGPRSRRQPLDGP